MEEDEDHDPWNEPSHRHPRAQKLASDEWFWDCVDELAPFGSDEGADAYLEFRSWRKKHPSADLIECMAWILDGKVDEYVNSAGDVTSAEAADESARSFGYEDAFTLDATIIATALGQLVDEGRIDVSAKPCAFAAISRQSHPFILAQHSSDAVSKERLGILESCRRIVESA